MIGMRKGLFGKPMQPAGMPEAYSMPQDMGIQDGANLANAPMQGERPGLGTRLFGEGWEGKAAALGSMLMGDPYAVGRYQEGQEAIRQKAAQDAAALRQRAEMLAAAQGMGIDPQQAALLGPEGLRQITVDRLKGPEEADVGIFEDNAGNRYRFNKRTGAMLDTKPFFVDPTERIINQNGALIRIPNPYAGAMPQGGGQATPDRLPADFFDSGEGARPNAATNPASRVTGARRITPQQYQQQLREFNGDQVSMNAWMRANNVLVD